VTQRLDLLIRPGIGSLYPQGYFSTQLRRTAPFALVGGPVAQNHDLTAALTSTALLAVALSMTVAFVLVLVVFRSLTIAISWFLLNLLGVAASFGFATLVFQHGWGACSSGSRWTSRSSSSPPSKSATRPPATLARPCAKGSPKPADPSPTPPSS
jgi:MMPL family